MNVKEEQKKITKPLKVALINEYREALRKYYKMRSKQEHTKSTTAFYEGRCAGLEYTLFLLGCDNEYILGIRDVIREEIDEVRLKGAYYYYG